MAYVKTLRMFLRVYELGSMSAAARDQRCSPAVASSRIAELEKHLGVRLFNRTTRVLKPTENGHIFYRGAQRILEAIEAAESEVAQAGQAPRGALFVAAPLGIGRRFIAPHIPDFKRKYPDVSLRLRLSDRSVDMMAEGLDLAFHLGPLEDSTLKLRTIAECPRVLAAAPGYIARHGAPRSGQEIEGGRHACLLLRFPGAREFRWTLQTGSGPRSFAVSGPFESDDGAVLTQWALEGHGIVLKPVFEIADHLRAGRLVPVAGETPPLPVRLACLCPHRRLRDMKLKLFMDFIIPRIRADLARCTEGLPEGGGLSGPGLSAPGSPPPGSPGTQLPR